MKAKSSKLFDLAFKSASLLAEIEGLDIEGQQLKQLSKTTDVDNNQTMLDTLEGHLGLIYRVSNHLLNQIQDTKKKWHKPKETEVSPKVLQAAKLLNDIDTLLRSNSYGSQFDQDLKKLTSEYREVQKSIPKSSRKDPHSIAAKKE